MILIGYGYGYSQIRITPHSQSIAGGDRTLLSGSGTFRAVLEGPGTLRKPCETAGKEFKVMNIINDNENH